MGNHSITATYNGDVNDEPSTSSAITQIVGKTTTSTTLYSKPNPSALNQSVTFEAKVTPSSATTGTVTFYHGSTVMGAGTLSGGNATLAVSTLSAGGHSITGVYNGDTDDSHSTSPILTQVVE